MWNVLSGTRCAAPLLILPVLQCLFKTQQLHHLVVAHPEHVRDVAQIGAHVHVVHVPPVPGDVEVCTQQAMSALTAAPARVGRASKPPEDVRMRSLQIDRCPAPLWRRYHH